MTEQVLVYEIKSSANVNAQELFSFDRKFFYWNETAFVNLQIGDFVIVVNTHSRWVLFTRLDKTTIPVTVSGNRTTFLDEGSVYEVSGRWNWFVRLEIIEEYPLPENWLWKSLGSSETTYLHGQRVNPSKAVNRLTNIQQLESLSQSKAFVDVLAISKANFSMLRTHEPSVWFVVQKDTFSEDKGMKFLWAPQRARDGRRMVHWDGVLQVKKGDIIFHYTQKALRGVSIAVSDGHEQKNGDKNSPWGEDGYSVDIEMISLHPPISLTTLQNHKETLDTTLTGISNNPFASDGRIKQGYLFEFSSEAGKLVRELYGKPFGNTTIDAYLDNFSQPLNAVHTMTVKETIQHIHDYIASQGFRYEYEEIVNFYLAIRAKPFVILAGISGTGKTQLPRKIAESLGFDEEQVIQIAVRPDWADSSDLLGYVSLDGFFYPKELTQAIQLALKNKKKPYFFILDEMNLARVEHYFSDFLSVIETRRRVGATIQTDAILRKEVLAAAKNAVDFPEMSWPQNLYLIGTVNMDETTHAFSRKVLDRANSIEMNQIDLDWMTVPEKRSQPLSGVLNTFFETPFVTSVELSEQNKADINYEMQLLQKVNKILQKADLHFAYRVRDEIAFYLVLNATHDLMSHKSAFDFQLVQKVLPRIHGSSERVLQVLVTLLNQLEGTAFRSTDFDFAAALKVLNTKELVYPRSSEKILFMLQRFDDDRFTSFWL